MATFINILGISAALSGEQPRGGSLMNRPNLLQHINKSYHKN